MKTKTKMIAFLEIAIVLCSLLLVALPAIAAEQTSQKMNASTSTITRASEDDYVLDIYGNANEDDTIDMRDLTYVKLIFFGKKPETELADAKYDGKINPLDFIQIKLIIVGKEKEITIVDSSGRTVTVNKPIKRIVVLLGGAVETMRSLKLEKDKIVGVDKWTKGKKIFYPEISECAADVGSYGSPDYEKLLELQPDTVIQYSALKYDAIVNKIKEADPKITVVRFDCWKSPIYIDEVKKLGYILGKKEEADKFVEFYAGWLNTIKEGVGDIPEDERPKVYFEGYKPYLSSGNKGGWHENVEMAGGHNIFSDISAVHGLSVDPEAVVKRNPDIIVRQVLNVEAGYTIDNPAKMSDIRKEIMNRPELANVIAVKNEKVYTIASEICSSASLFVGITYMAKWFHPELFEDLNPKAIHQEYLTEFQGLDFDLDKQGVFVYHPEEHPDGK